MFNKILGIILVTLYMVDLFRASITLSTIGGLILGVSLIIIAKLVDIQYKLDEK